MSFDDPIATFHEVFAEALARESFDASRAALATSTAEGVPSVRFVLVKDADARGFVVFTNLNSPKAREMHDNPHAALAFHWASTGVQVRVSGRVTPVEPSESDTYFASRPRGSQLGAWASPQSEEIADREVLLARVREAGERFSGCDVERPEFWGGLRITPERIEFWYDREDRLHDRFLFVRDGAGWRRSRLAP